MIHIDKDWYVDVDQYSYTLEQYTGDSVDKDGVVRHNYKNQTYHATLDKALKQYCREVIKGKLAERDMELKEAIELIKDLSANVDETVERILNL